MFNLAGSPTSIHLTNIATSQYCQEQQSLPLPLTWTVWACGRTRMLATFFRLMGSSTRVHVSQSVRLPPVTSGGSRAVFSAAWGGSSAAPMSRPPPRHGSSAEKVDLSHADQEPLTFSHVGKHLLKEPRALLFSRSVAPKACRQQLHGCRWRLQSHGIRPLSGVAELP